MINRIICILYTAGHTYAQLATTDWRIETDKDPVTKKESIILSKRSTSTQIFNYERIYGRLSIRSNGDKLDIYMNWGGFISVGKSYVKCKIGDNELRGDSWLISGEYDITVAPDPFLMLLQMSTSEKAIFYTTPKGLTQLSHSFHLAGLKEILDQYPHIFYTYADWISRMKDSTNIDQFTGSFGNNVDKYFQQETIFRRLNKKIEHYPEYMLRPIWHIDSLRAKFELSLPDEDIFFYYNRWIKKTGILFTRYDIMFQESSSEMPRVVPYRDIDKVTLNGNAFLGYRLMINGENLSRIFHTDQKIRNALEVFLISMSDLEKKYQTK